METIKNTDAWTLLLQPVVPTPTTTKPSHSPTQPPPPLPLQDMPSSTENSPLANTPFALLWYITTQPLKYRNRSHLATSNSYPPPRKFKSFHTLIYYSSPHALPHALTAHITNPLTLEPISYNQASKFQLESKFYGSFEQYKPVRFPKGIIKRKGYTMTKLSVSWSNHHYP